LVETYRQSAMIRKLAQKIIRCTHHHRMQCLLALCPNDALV
jgi:hypothetical protein